MWEWNGQAQRGQAQRGQARDAHDEGPMHTMKDLKDVVCSKSDEDNFCMLEMLNGCPSLFLSRFPFRLPFADFALPSAADLRQGRLLFPALMSAFMSDVNQTELLLGFGFLCARATRRASTASPR